MRNIRAKYEGRCFWGGGKFFVGKSKKGRWEKGLVVELLCLI